MQLVEVGWQGRSFVEGTPFWTVLKARQKEHHHFWESPQIATPTYQGPWCPLLLLPDPIREASMATQNREQKMDEVSEMLEASPCGFGSYPGHGSKSRTPSEHPKPH